MFSRWFNGVKQGKPKRRNLARPLAVETLEERALPSTVTSLPA